MVNTIRAQMSREGQKKNHFSFLWTTAASLRPSDFFPREFKGQWTLRVRYPSYHLLGVPDTTDGIAEGCGSNTISWGLTPFLGYCT